MGRRFRTIATAALIAATVAACGCSSDADDAAEVNQSEDTQPSESAEPATREEMLTQRLAEVKSSDLVMGAAFNAELLRLGFLTVGFTEEEAKCSSDVLVQNGGERFDRVSVAELFAGDSLSPDLLLSCLTPERMQAVGPTATPPTPSPEASAQYRQLMVGLVSAGFESVGLTAMEASCLVGESITDDASNPSMTAMPETRLSVEAVTSCVDKNRIAQLVP